MGCRRTASHDSRRLAGAEVFEDPGPPARSLRPWGGTASGQATSTSSSATRPPVPSRRRFTSRAIRGSTPTSPVRSRTHLRGQGARRLPGDQAPVVLRRHRPFHGTGTGAPAPRQPLPRPPSPVVIQSFEVGNLQELAGRTRLPLVQFVDRSGLLPTSPPPGTTAPTPTWSPPRDSPSWRPTPTASVLQERPHPWATRRDAGRAVAGHRRRPRPWTARPRMDLPTGEPLPAPRPPPGHRTRRCRRHGGRGASVPGRRHGPVLHRQPGPRSRSRLDLRRRRPFGSRLSHSRQRRRVPSVGDDVHRRSVTEAGPQRYPPAPRCGRSLPLSSLPTCSTKKRS